MSVVFLKRCLFLLTSLFCAAALLLGSASCEIKDPLAENEQTTETAAQIERDLSAFESPEEAKVYTRAGGNLSDGWWYDSAEFYFEKEYEGKTFKTAFRYNLQDERYEPVCRDPICMHKSGEYSQCPFALGGEILFVENGVVYYTGIHKQKAGFLEHCAFYSYDLNTMRHTELFEYYRMIQDRAFWHSGDFIYYTTSEMNDDMTYTRSLCRFDLRAGKSSTLGVIDRIETETPTSLDLMTMRYENAVYPCLVTEDGKILFDTIDPALLYRKVMEDGFEVNENTDYHQYSIATVDDPQNLQALGEPFISALPVFYLRNGTLYTLTDNINEYPKPEEIHLMMIDLETGEQTVRHEKITREFVIHGDYLYYQEADGGQPIMISSAGEEPHQMSTYASGRIVKENLQTGEKTFYDLPSSEEGVPNCIMIDGYDSGRLILSGWFAKSPEDPDVYIPNYGGHAVFDMVENKIYPLGDA